MRDLTDRTPAERLFHAVAFEAIAIVLCVPAIAWAMSTPVAETSALTIAISLIATGWNMLFNALFDRLQKRWRFERTPVVRIVHAAVFEAGLVCACVPLAAWWLGISLWAALLLDAALLLFFLPYGVAYNWAYDTLRARWVGPDRRSG